MTGRRLLRRLIVAASVLLGVSVSLWSSLGSDAPAATAKSQSCTASSCIPTYTAEYKGTFSFSQDYEGAGTSAGTFLRTTDTLTWDEKVITKARNPQDPSTWTYQKTLTASGSTTVASSNSPSFSCTLTQAANPNLNLLTVGPNTLKADTVNVSAFFPSDQLTASGTSPLCGGLTDYDCTDSGCVGVCSDGWASAADAAMSQKFDDALTPSMNAAKSPDSIPYGATQKATSNCLLTITGPTPKSVGTETATRSISGTLTIGGGCSVAAAALGATPDSGPAYVAKGGLKIIGGPREAGGFPYTFSSFKLKLSADAGGGCPKYHFRWRLVASPARDRVSVKRGVKVTVSPESAGPQTRQSTATQEIKLTCSVPRALRRRLSISPRNPTLTPCRGSVRYRVDVTDSGPGPKTGSATINLYWDPKCISSDIRRALERKRDQIVEEIHQDLLTKGFKAIGTKGIEALLAAETLGPYLLAHELAEAVLDYAKLQQEYDRLTNDLSEPNC